MHLGENAMFPGSDKLIIIDSNNWCYTLKRIYTIDLSPHGNLTKQNADTLKLQTVDQVSGFEPQIS